MEAKHQRIFDLLYAGTDIKTIVNLLSIPKTTVYRIVKAGIPKQKPPKVVNNKKRTPVFLKQVKTIVENDPNMSIRKVAKKMNVDEKTIRTSLKDLRKKSVIRPPRHLLTPAQKKVRLEHGKVLLNKLKSMAKLTVKIFSDKKVFTVDQAYNRRNDRQIVNMGEAGDPVSRTKHPASVMHLGIVSSNGKKAPPIFVPDGEKVNSEVYINILATKLVPWLRKTFPEGNYVFQQDSAPAHASKKTQEWLRANVAEFWDKNVWPSNSPDLNPLDFSIWSVVESKACQTSHLTENH
jgi:transposase